jgi:anthranilate phosphoribosyltransferase
MRTIFNLVGPLANPAETKRQIVGVFSPDWLMPMAEALLRLGAEHAWVVHGAGGLDELSTLGASSVVEVKDGALRRFEVSPADAGLESAAMADLMGGTPSENAKALRALFDGEPGPYRDIVLLNSAAALIVAGRAGDLAEGAQMAQEIVDKSAAKAALERLIETGDALVSGGEAAEAASRNAALPEPASVGAGS